jgi:hypothetical protein
MAEKIEDPWKELEIANKIAGLPTIPWEDAVKGYWARHYHSSIRARELIEHVAKLLGPNEATEIFEFTIKRFKALSKQKKKTDYGCLLDRALLKRPRKNAKPQTHRAERDRME